jgi:glycosyltransferase involved in cell wall biosynthesis
MKQVIFVGWIRTGKPPVDGETAKNQYIIAELKKYCKVTVLDFYQKSRHPWIFLQALWALVSQPKAMIVFSTSAKNVYGTLKLFRALHLKRDVIHWVIGGIFGNNIQNGVFDAEVFGYAKYTIVESHAMVKQLQKCGIKGVSQLPNFKAIPNFPDLNKALNERKRSSKKRFVFLSRVMPKKGCDYILEAIKTLNEKGLHDRFCVDFYGKMDEAYEERFTQIVNQLDNANYHGILDLKTAAGYDTLATYHAMLFPTYWKGEGFAGVFIDAFIAGLPMLVSDWAHNSEIIRDGELGILYPVHDVKALTDTMEKCILGEINLERMAVHARQEASKYDAAQVLNEDYLRSIGLIER